MNYYIGLDAHAQTCTGVVVNERGEIKAQKTFRTTEANLIDFVKSVKRVRYLTFEEGTLAQWIYGVLLDEVDHILVCNPLLIPPKQGAKTDFRDALHLAQSLRGGYLKAVHHEVSVWQKLRTIVQGYKNLVEDSVAMKNQLHALFRGCGISISQGDFCINRDHVNRLATEEQKFVANSLYSRIAEIETQKKSFIEIFRKNMTTLGPIKRLATVPGISVVRANIIAAAVCDANRFENKHRFWAYASLVRHIQVSGGKTYGHKKIYGHTNLRAVFVGATDSALRGSSSLRTYYNKLREQGKCHRDARNALARKIASISLSILKNDTVFDDSHEKSPTERKMPKEEVTL